MVALPAAAFTASILLDVLALIADSRGHAQTYERAAADLLRLGLSSSLAALALEVVDYLRAPVGEEAPGATGSLALNGAVVAVYLLDVAARQERVRPSSLGPQRVDALAVGLSLMGLGFLGFAARRA